MRIYRYVIGILFHQKMHRLSSLNGSVIDEILRQQTDRGIPDIPLTMVSKNNKDGTIAITNEDRSTEIHISPDHFIVKNSVIDGDASATFEKAFEKFRICWEISNEILAFPPIRRIGIVAEFHLRPRGDAGATLVKSITKLPVKGQVSLPRFSFHEKRRIDGSNEPIDAEFDNFENLIRGFYLSEMDETPTEGYITAMLDLQRFYNPVKREPLKEISSLRKRFSEEKEAFKKQISDMEI